MLTPWLVCHRRSVVLRGRNSRGSALRRTRSARPDVRFVFQLFCKTLISCFSYHKRIRTTCEEPEPESESFIIIIQSTLNWTSITSLVSGGTTKDWTDLCTSFRLSLVGPRGQRPSHQVLTSGDLPQAFVSRVGTHNPPGREY